MRSNVLIVAQSRETQVSLANKLNTDYHIFTSRGLSDALQVIGQQQIVLLICEAGLQPEIGWMLCRQFKSNLLSAHIPMILLTAEDSVQARLKSLEAGADGHIGGTIYREHLDIQIRNLLSNRLKVRRHFANSPATVEKGSGEQERFEILKKLHNCLNEQAPAGELTVDDLARLMHMSRPTLYRKMKAITDLTPNELINEVRLKRAAELLAAGEYRIFEVARMVGYGSQSSFGKSFLKQFKVTPATYQRMKKIMDAA